MGIKVAILGNGWFSELCAHILVNQAGYEVVLLRETESDGIGIYSLYEDRKIDLSALEKIDSNFKIEDIRGRAGGFKIQLRVDRRIRQIEVDVILIAYEPILKKNLDLEHKENIIWLSELNVDKDEFPRAKIQNVGFISGISKRSYLVLQRLMMERCLELRSLGFNVILIVPNLLVSQRGLERLSKNLREKGVQIIKSDRVSIEGRDEAGRLRCRVYEGGVDEEIELLFDRIILEDQIFPPPDSFRIFQLLNISFDNKNIHNTPFFSERDGIYILGSAVSPIPFELSKMQIYGVISEIEKLRKRLKAQKDTPGNIPEFERGRCGSCLTCLRSCPHSAISFLYGRPEFDPIACKLCGVCAGVCPMDAIQIPEYEDKKIVQLLERGLKEDGKKRVLFFCANSPGDSLSHMAHLGLTISEEIVSIEIPCVGRLDPVYIWKSLEMGAEKVFILHCPSDGCKSYKGPEVAYNRIESIEKQLKEMGIDQKNIVLKAIGPSLGKELFDFLNKALGNRSGKA